MKKNSRLSSSLYKYNHVCKHLCTHIYTYIHAYIFTHIYKMWMIVSVAGINIDL